METLNAQIESQLMKAGASLIGFADLNSLPTATRSGMKFGISIAVALDVSIVGEISKGPTMCYYHEYTRVNEFLAKLCASTVNYLKGCGHGAEATVPTIRIDMSAMNALATPLPHKTVATRAGLGWIGKSALLITQRYGPAVRLGTVLTDAPLEAGDPIDDSHCGDCRKCVDHCPAEAILGKNWQRGSERASIYDAYACCAMAKDLAGREGIPVTICGICINVCPWTQKYISRAMPGA